MAWRKHADNHADCWCDKKYPVEFAGRVVGEATPLEDGNYSVVFTNHDPLKDGNVVDYSGLIIKEPTQGELFTMEEDENDD
ncbi:hypothetical protein SEA_GANTCHERGOBLIN_61 [Arthrobacter phage GantcherGoblin]|nr:hypothetical protein SEA_GANTCHERGOBLIN_61 [Arthrobacter phage GantcherGoblin]